MYSKNSTIDERLLISNKNVYHEIKDESDINDVYSK
jgi:hypothetical protein